MRILMVSDFYAPYVGGVEVLVGALSRELARRGHSVAVATLGRDDLPPHAVEDGVRVHRLRGLAQRFDGLFAAPDRPWAPPAPDPLLARGLAAVVRRERPDVVHGHDWLARSYVPAARRGRRPALVHSLHYYTLRCSTKTLMRAGAPCAGPGPVRCLRCAGAHYGAPKGALVAAAQLACSRLDLALVDRFLPVSEATAAGNGLRGARHRYRVIPNFVGPPGDAAPHRSLLATLPGEPFLLFVGDLRRDKGVHVLLDAYRRLRRPAPLVLLGKVGPEGVPDLPDGARLLEGWPNAAVRAAMASALALVAPSIWPEPFGIVVAEALAAGLPVVASAAGGIPEVARHEREALLVAPGDAPALARALERIVGDEALRERLARAAALRAGAFTPEAVVPQFEAVYRELLDARSAASPRLG
jgi:glycosyltransferase involved in cell wall biosynthesis